jgi:hypothetical protein
MIFASSQKNRYCIDFFGRASLLYILISNSFVINFWLEVLLLAGKFYVCLACKFRIAHAERDGQWIGVIVYFLGGIKI